MIFFGHLGLTGLAAKVVEKSNKEIQIDYRIIMIGSILPDIIDKPIGRFLFPDVFNTGRLFAHTLLFILILLGFSIYRYIRFKKIGWFVLTGSCLFHDLFDFMWTIPVTFFWPIFGLEFYSKEDGQWFMSSLEKLMTDPTYFVPEIIGFAVVVYFIGGLIFRKKVKSFIKDGKLY